MTSKDKHIKKIHDEFQGVQKRLKYLIILLIAAALIVLVVLALFFVKPDPCKAHIDIEKDICYFDLVENDSSRNYCGSILTPELKDACISLIAIESNDPQLCSKLSSGPKGSCFKNIAEGRVESDLCGKIDSPYWRNLCFKSLVNLTDDTMLCRQIDSNMLWDACFYDYALSRNYSKACNGINNRTIQGKCNFKLAIETSDFALCDKTVLNSYQGMCFQHFAYLNNDSLFCDSINAGVIRQDCLEHFNLTYVPKNDTVVNPCMRLAEAECDDKPICKPVYSCADCDSKEFVRCHTLIESIFGLELNEKMQAIPN